MKNFTTLKGVLRLGIFALSLLVFNGIFSQTTIINPTGDGGFDNGPSFLSNGWTVVNDANSANNNWYVGNAPGAFAGTNAAYISNTSGLTWAYSPTTVSTTHFYRDVTVPANENVISLNFQWKGSGESGWDRLLIYAAPVTTNPFSGFPASNASAYPGATLLYTQANNAQASYTNAAVTIPSSFAGTTFRLIFTWQNDASFGASPGVAIDNVSLTSAAPALFTSSAIGGQWSSPATWVGGVVPAGGNLVTIAAGSVVTIDQAIAYAELNVNGTLQWGATSFPVTIGGNITINPGGRYLAYTSAVGGSTGTPTTLGGNFINNGYANFAVGTTTGAAITFNGAGSTLGGSGVFEGDGSRGIIRGIVFSNIGANAITTTQPLTTYSFVHTAGSLNTNGKLKIDNTALIHGLPINTRVESVHMTNMGANYNVAPVVFGSAVTPYSNGAAATIGTRYFNGNNVFLCTANGTFNANPPTSTAPTEFTTSGPSLIWIGTLGTIGTNLPYNQVLSTATPYFYGANLYQALTSTAQTVMPTHTSGVVGNFLYLGLAAKVAVNYDATTQTVRSLSITNNGTGYNSSTAPGLTISNGVGGTGAGASAVPVILYVLNGGGNSATQKSGIATITGGLNINSDSGASLLSSDPQASAGVSSVFATNGGFNYTVVPLVGFTGPTALNLVTNVGSGYTAAPTVVVTGGTLVSGAALTTANFTVTVNQGKVVSVYLNANTSLYSIPPTLSFSGGNATLAFPAGCWPTATANIGANRQLLSFTVTNSGFGYVAAPTVGVGATSGSAAGGTFTAQATGLSARCGLYLLVLNYFAPATSAVANADDAAIPTNRKLVQLQLAGNGNGLNLNSDLISFGTTPFVLTASGNVPGNVLDLGGNNLICTWQAYAGAFSTFGATNTYLKNGAMTVYGRGGGTTGSAYNFPFSGTFSCNTGAGTAITGGSDITRMTVRETAAPSNTTQGGTAAAVGNRAFRVQTQSTLNPIGISGTNPTVTLRYNSQDNLTSTQDQTFVGEGTTLSGQWNIKSAAIGAGGNLAATGLLASATVAPGPIALTGDVFYAWAGLAPTITSVAPLIVCASSGSFTITGTNLLGVSAVNIGGTPASAFTVVSATQIDAFAGPGTTGVVSIVKNGTTYAGNQTITVSPSPSAPSAAPATATVSFGSTATFTASSSTAGTYNWYLFPNGGTPISTGASFITPPACLNTTYYVGESNGSCEGARTAVTVNTIPITASSSITSFCGTGGNTTLSVSPVDPNVTYTWTTNTATALIPINVGPTVTATLSETSEIYMTSTLNGCIATNAFSVGVYPLPTATVTTSASGVCPGTSATINSGLSSSNFAVSSIPYVPYTIPSNATVICSNGVPTIPLSGGNLDDGGWGNIPIGFTFNFFGTNFTSLAAGTNGLLMFGTVPGYGTAAGQLGQFAFNGGPVSGAYQYFPNPANPGNVISLMAGDQYFGSGTNGSATSDLIYWTSGFAPNRVFNILYQDVNRCCGAANPSFSAYARLFETIGNVEVHILNNNQSTFSNVVGLQDVTKTIGAVAPGRPTQNQVTGVATPWGVTTPEGWRFVPPSNYTTVWTATNSVGTSTIATGTNIFSQAVSPLETTTYNISYTNQTTGCTNTPGSANVQMVIFSNVAPVGVNTIAPPGVCNGSNFSLSTDYTGSLNGLSLQWQVSLDGGVTYNDIVGATATSYNTLMNATGTYRLRMIACNGTPSYSSAATVINNALPSISVTPISAPYCLPGGTAVTMTASGTSTSYAWSPALGLSAATGSSVDASPTATTIYTVTGTDGNGCSSSTTAEIILASSVTMNSALASPAAICFNQNATLSALATAAPGTYCQPVSSCTFPDMITNVTFGSINNTTLCDGGTTGGFTLFSTFNPTIAAGATLPLSVSTGGDIEGAAVWIDFNKNGVYEASELVLSGLAGTNPATYTGSIFIPLSATNGTTRMRVRCAYNANPSATNIGPCNNITFGETEDYLITITGGVDPLTYTWSPNTNLNNTLGSSVIVSNAIATTTYTVVATSAQGCSATTTATLVVNPLPQIGAGNDVLICTNSGSQVFTPSGTGAGVGGSYTWNNGAINAQPFTVTQTATFIVTGVDANACVNYDTLQVVFSPVPPASAGVDQQICIGQTATLPATGLAPFTWTTTAYPGSGISAPVVNPLLEVTPTTPGVYTYTVGVINGVGCTNEDQVQLTVWALPTINAGVDQTICNASPSILAGSGGLTYTWTNNVTNATPFFPSSTATYTVDGVDINGCHNVDQVTVTVLPQPIVNGGIDQTICATTPAILFAQTTASTPTAVTGFQWNNNVTNGQQFTPTATATYTVTATGANGCTNQDQVVVNVLALPTVNAGNDITVCAGLSATLNATGAASYSWNNGITQAIPFYPNATTTYTVTGTGANGCANQDQVVVTVSTGPTVTVSGSQVICANAPATLSAASTNSMGGFWTTSNGFGTISPNVSNGTVTYTPTSNDPVVVNLTYVASNACGNVSQSTSVTVLPIPSVNAGPDIASCSGLPVTLSATSNGFITWNNNVSNNVAFVPGSTATYTVTAVGANNCTNSDQMVLTVLALPDVNAGADQTICSGTSATLNGSGANTYLWNNGVVNSVAFAPTATQTYTVTGTALNGCQSTDEVLVTVNATPVALVSIVDDVTIAASPAGMNYQWINCASGTDIPTATAAQFTAAANGSYAVIVTSLQGCEDVSDCIDINSVGLDQINISDMNVFPNPTNGEVNVTMPENMMVDVQIFDAQGKLVAEQMNVTNNGKLNISNVTPGVYMVRLTAENAVQTFRVVKN